MTMLSSAYKRFFKFILEWVIAFVAFVIISPVFIFITLLLLVSNNGKVFFTQQRPGKHCHVFKIVKFRTMNDRRDKNGTLLPDSIRLSTIGKFVRKTSLDEVPQLWNIIKGDMSLVGPRPLLVEYLPLYNAVQSRRHEVRPGITGWAQVNGRNAISWDKKFEYDIWYIDNMSFLLDMKILFLSVKKVFMSEGISSHHHVYFKGNNQL